MNMLCGDKRDVDKCDVENLHKNNKIITNHKSNHNNVHKSGKSVSGKNHDKIDYGAIDGRASTAATVAVAKARSPNKRAQKIDGSASATPATESFTLPRVVLRQR